MNETRSASFGKRLEILLNQEIAGGPRNVGDENRKEEK